MDDLETARLRLVPWRQDLEADFVRLASDERVTRYIGDGRPFSRDRTVSRHRALLQDWVDHGFGWRGVIEQATGAFAGLVALNHLGSRVEGLPETAIEIGWWLDPDFWGRGIGTEAALAARDEAFGRVGADQIVGRFQPANTGSGRIMTKLGMTWCKDVVDPGDITVRVYTLARSTWQSAQPPT
jgi:RimJ/RimL family protein N-acetyltransferase